MQSQQKQKQRNKEERVKEALRVAKYRKAKKESGDGEAKKKSLTKKYQKLGHKSIILLTVPPVAKNGVKCSCTNKTCLKHF